MSDVKKLIIENIGLAIIDRPPTNAVGADTLANLCVILDELENDENVKAIILTSEGKNFCAGADFGFLQDLTQTPTIEVRDKVYTHFQGAARRIYRSIKPTIAAINGAAVTVGCELALACDFRIIGNKAMFQESWIKLGLLPPLGGMFLLQRIVGVSMANEMILRGRAVKAEEAMNIGIATKMVDADELRDSAIELAKELSALPPMAYRLAKEGLQRGAESQIDREWAAGVLAQSILIGSDDFKEGLASVVEKRTPNFKGK